MNHVLILHLLVYVNLFEVANAVVFYITPVSRISCSEEPCLTLSQFAMDTNRFCGNQTNVSLIFLPGNHFLSKELYLTYVENLSMSVEVQDVFVECLDHLGRFNISRTTIASISGLHFVGCGGNRITQIGKFKLEDTTFKSAEGREAVLMLMFVAAATVVNSSFLSNLITCGDLGSAVISSSVSSLHIFNSTFMNNHATHGGVMLTINSFFVIANSIQFCYKLWWSLSHSNILVQIVTNCTFIGNRALSLGGVLSIHLKPNSKLLIALLSTIVQPIMVEFSWLHSHYQTKLLYVLL